MALPNFVVIGSSRSGTTSLYQHLNTHPQIYMTPMLEPRFFAFEGDSMDYRGPGDHLLAKRVITRFSDYAVLFDGVADELAVGDISPAYLSSERAPRCLQHYIPDAKIIAILRHPVERAISSFRLERLNGWETETDLAVALDLEDQRMRAKWSYVWGYGARGLYHSHLKRYYTLFPHEQIKIMLYEQWHDWTRLLTEVFRFLGVDEEAGLPAQALHENTTHVERFRTRGLDRFEPSPELRSRLADMYREEIEKLELLIGMDLTSWR